MNLLRSSSIRALLLIAAAPLITTAQSADLGPDPVSPNLAHSDLAACRIHQVSDLPGSHQFAADFTEVLANDPAPIPRDRHTVFALTADLDSRVAPRDRALYISRSTNDGATWTPIARIGSQYFNADISEGLRNSLAVSPGASDFVITTQLGAFQVIPQRNPDAPVIRLIPGPRVPSIRPTTITIAKHAGDPVRAGVALITAGGQRLIIAYGYFDDNPQLFLYRRDHDSVHETQTGSWVEDGTLPHLPTDLDIFSMQFDNPRSSHPDSLYVGTGDQAYRLDLHTLQWTRVAGVGPDSAIHSMSTVDGLHIAACWGVYTPINADTVARVTHAKFLLHRWKDQVGPNIRAYAIAVDPLRPNRETIATITGVYVSSDSGQSWRRLNDLPEGEFHSAHFNPDGTILVSGFIGTFLANPFSKSCSPTLKTRGQ